MTRMIVPNVKYVWIQTVPHGAQRYDTIGDWLWHPEHKRVEIITSDLGDWRMSMACAVHELVETMLCVNDGVDEERISRFDMAYEAARKHRLNPLNHHQGSADLELLHDWGCDCEITADSEPGEDRHAPYRKQHAFADGIERLLANELGIVWDEYAEKVTSLDYDKERAKYAASQEAKV